MTTTASVVTSRRRLVDGALAYLSMVWGNTDAAPAPPLSVRAGTGRLIATTFRCADDDTSGCTPVRSARSAG